MINEKWEIPFIPVLRLRYIIVFYEFRHLVLHFISTETCVRPLEKRKSNRIVICDWLFVICYLTP